MYYDMEKSGARIRQLRMKEGYTQEKVAQALNINRSFYSRIESGKNGCSVDLLVQLSDLFDVSLDYLVLGKYNCAVEETTEKAMLKADVEIMMAHLKEFRDAL